MCEVQYERVYNSRAMSNLYDVVSSNASFFPRAVSSSVFGKLFSLKNSPFTYNSELLYAAYIERYKYNVYYSHLVENGKSVTRIRILFEFRFRPFS